MKKLIALLLIVVMSFSFSACSSGEDTSTSEEPEAAEQEEVCTILSRFNGNVKKQYPLRISDIGSDWKIMC